MRLQPLAAPRCLLMFAAALMFSAAPLAAQNATVQGVVTDAESGQALEGASISLEREGQAVRGTFADRNGFYLLGGVTPGTYTIRISFLAHAPHVESLTLQAGEDRRESV